MPYRVVVLSLWVIILPILFSTFLYGAIRPELGGGAVWKARLTWRATADSSARTSTSGVVAIIDRDENTLNLIACSQSGRPSRFSVAAADVSSIQLGELVSPQAFLDDYVHECRRIDSEPKSQGELRRNLLVLTLALGALSALLLYTTVGEIRRATVRRKASEEDRRD